MYIAICDDNREEIAKIRNAILDIQGTFLVDTFQSGRALLESVKNGACYELLFCDIYMDGENGLDVAREMQNLSPATAIVFTTTSTEHAVEAFSIRALHYLVKPVKADDVAEVFRRMEVKEEPRHTLTLRIDRVINVLYQDEIIRVEGADHRTVITATGGEYSIWKPYREVCELLDETFLSIKKGVTVNMSHISQMTTRECILRDGSVYLLRRDRAKEIREQYFTFIENELNKH